VDLLGLTGGVGMGKSAAAEYLSGRGLAVVDTDLLARQVVEPGQAALDEIAGTFGGGVLDGAGRLRRDALARLVFAEPEARRKLEAIVHPRIRALWHEAVREWRDEGRALAVVVIPLLFETDAQAEFDLTVCVACTAGTQLERLVARGWTSDEISRRNQAQWPIWEKMALATHVIWTEGTMEAHWLQWERLLNLWGVPRVYGVRRLSEA